MWPAIFLPLNTLPGILTLAGRTVRTVRDRVTVRGAATSRVKFQRFIDTLETLADRRARHVDELAGDEVVGR